MKWPWQKFEQKDASLESILQQIAGLYETTSGVSVNAENCMRSPTVRAVVTAVSNRIAVSPVHLFRKTTSNGRDSKEPLPSHPIARLLQTPNAWQTSPEYWSEATSSLMRHGRFFSFKGRGVTGPIRELVPLHAGQTEIMQDRETLAVSFRYNGTQIYQPSKIHYVRLAARDFLRGDSPIFDIRESIGLEIAAEKFGSSFFGNGAMPFIYFKLMEGAKDFKTDEEKLRFLQGFKEAFGGKKSFSTMMLPKAVELATVTVENDKAQFIETRRFIRTVIAGAFGVPPHLVGDLDRATFNNVEQQDADFVLNVVLPIARLFEAAMERDLLTEEDRRSGVVIRFNLDAVQRADFKTRQEGRRMMLEAGALSPNEWREGENMNPIPPDKGGDDYRIPANFNVAGEVVEEPPSEDGVVTPLRGKR